jgi:hypothetical protein
MNYSCLLITFIAVFAVAGNTHNVTANNIDTTLALQYFHEAERASRADNGRVWGKTLYGPMLFVDPATRRVVANEPSQEGLLTPQDGVYIGTLPNSVAIANYAVNWAGVHWTMVMWPSLSGDPYNRLKLMMHESFHRIQNDLGYLASNPSNDHLDTVEGRYWLQLEWRALQAALNDRSDKRRRDINAALTFREYRRSLYAGSAEMERELEMNEGLAEYTGTILASSGVSRKVLIDNVSTQIGKAPQRPTFVRSFAYVSGPAYGVLLDESTPMWRHSLKSTDDIGLILRHALKITLSSDLKVDAKKLALQFNGGLLLSTESDRDNDRKRIVSDYKVRLVDGPTLTIHITDKGQYSFDPNSLIPLDSSSTIYPTAHVIDSWGILDVSKGALFVAKKGMVTNVVVAAPALLGLKETTGVGWKLQLADGWAIEPAGRPGCYELKRVTR